MTEPDWVWLFQMNRRFRAISIAVGDRHKPLRAWCVFGYIGQMEHAGGSLHGPWRLTPTAAIRAVYRRARVLGQIPEKSSPA